MARGPRHADNCPPETQLRRLFENDLSEEESSQVAGHLEHCDSCAQIVRRTTVVDDFEQILREGEYALPETDGEMVRRLMEQLGNVRRDCQEIPTPSLERTSTLRLGQAGDSEGDAAEEIREIVALFEPSQRVGDLGRIGAYHVKQVLGAGGMGVVFEGEDVELQRAVAIKVMLPSTAKKAYARDRFLREARTVAAIEHDNIVPIHQVETHRALPFLVMPLLRGESLETRLLRRGTLGVAETLKIGREIALGLSAAHRQQVIHRDIKPANLWLETRDPLRVADNDSATSDRSDSTFDVRTRILDFGLARPLEAATQLTEEGGLAGTPPYMSPEQANGESIDSRTDLFSLGCVLYRCLTGETAFSETTVMATLLALTLKTPQPIVRDDVPPQLADFVMTMLEKDASRRPVSATEVARRLAEFEQERRRPPDADLASNGTGRGWLLVAGVLAATLLLTAFAVTVRLPTKNATIVLEFEDDQTVDAVISIDQQPMGVVRPEDVGESLTIQIRPGNHLLQIAKGDRELLTASIQLKSRGQRTIQVRVEGDQQVELPATDPTRRAIAWVCAAGGHVHGYAGGEPVEFATQHLENYDQPLVVYRIHFDYGDLRPEEMSDEHLKNLRGLKTLELLRFRPWSGSLSDACLAELTTLSNLRGLSMSGQALVTDQGAGEIAKLAKLEQLDLSGTGIGDAGLRRLAGLSQLTKIDVRGTAVSQRGVRSFEQRNPSCVVVSDHTAPVVLSSAGITQQSHVSLEESLPTPRAYQVAIAADGSTVAWASGDTPAKVVLSDLQGATPRELTLEDPGYVQTLAFSPSGRRLAITGSGGQVKVVAADTLVELSAIELSSKFAPAAVFVSEDGLWFAEPNVAESVAVYDLRTGESRRLSIENVHRLAVSADGSSVALHQWGIGRVEVWDARTLQRKQTIQMPKSEVRVSHAGAFDGIGLSSDGSLLVTPGEDGVVRLWDTSSGEQLHALTGHVHHIHRAVFSPAGSLLASAGSDKAVRIWNVESGELLATLVDHEAIVPFLQFAGDERRLVTGSWDGTAKLWQVGAR